LSLKALFLPKGLGLGDSVLGSFSTEDKGDGMSATEKLREALIELKADRMAIDRKIAAIETALGDGAIGRKRRGRKPRPEGEQEKRE
jgi:hypothetical protein